MDGTAAEPMPTRTLELFSMTSPDEFTVMRFTPSVPTPMFPVPARYSPVVVSPAQEKDGRLEVSVAYPWNCAPLELMMMSPDIVPPAFGSDVFATLLVAKELVMTSLNLTYCAYFFYWAAKTLASLCGRRGRRRAS
jgi:hypothetical protein